MRTSPALADGQKLPEAIVSAQDARGVPAPCLEDAETVYALLMYLADEIRPLVARDR
jgi:hypothetical protein